MLRCQTFVDIWEPIALPSKGITQKNTRRRVARPLIKANLVKAVTAEPEQPQSLLIHYDEFDHKGMRTTEVCVFVLKFSTSYSPQSHLRRGTYLPLEQHPECATRITSSAQRRRRHGHAGPAPKRRFPCDSHITCRLSTATATATITHWGLAPLILKHRPRLLGS
jgi:hypothetical protein